MSRFNHNESKPRAGHRPLACLMTASLLLSTLSPLAEARRNETPPPFSRAENISDRRSAHSTIWPEGSGHLTDTYWPLTGHPGPLFMDGKVFPFILHIQDAHDLPQAQLALSEMLGTLALEERLPKTLCVEGAWGPLSLAWLADIPDKDRRDRLAQQLLEAGFLTGEEHFAATQPGDHGILGVDDPALHAGNTAARVRLSADASVLLRQIRTIRNNLACLKPRLYKTSLARWDALRSGYEKGTPPFPDFVRRAAAFLPVTEFERDFPQLFTVAKLSALEKDLPADKEFLADRFRRAMERVPASVLRPFASALASAQAGRVPWKKALDTYLQFPAPRDAVVERVLTSRSLGERVSLRDSELELRWLIKRIEKRLSSSCAPREARLMELDRWLDIGERLWSRTMTPEDWKEYQAARTEWTPDRMKKQLKEFGQGKAEWGYLFRARWAEAEAFYQLARRRDQAMASRTLAAARQADGRAVLITGGFHTPGLTRRFRDGGASYATFLPRFRVEETALPSNTLRQASVMSDPSSSRMARFMSFLFFKDTDSRSLIARWKTGLPPRAFRRAASVRILPDIFLNNLRQRVLLGVYGSGDQKTPFAAVESPTGIEWVEGARSLSLWFATNPLRSSRSSLLKALKLWRGLFKDENILSALGLEQDSNTRLFVWLESMLPSPRRAILFAYRFFLLFVLAPVAVASGGPEALSSFVPLAWGALAGDIVLRRLLDSAPARKSSDQRLIIDSMSQRELKNTLEQAITKKEYDGAATILSKILVYSETRAAFLWGELGNEDRLNVLGKLTERDRSLLMGGLPGAFKYLHAAMLDRLSYNTRKMLEEFQKPEAASGPTDVQQSLARDCLSDFLEIIKTLRVIGPESMPLLPPNQEAELVADILKEKDEMSAEVNRSIRLMENMIKNATWTESINEMKTKLNSQRDFLASSRHRWHHVGWARNAESERHRVNAFSHAFRQRTLLEINDLPGLTINPANLLAVSNLRSYAGRFLRDLTEEAQAEMESPQNPEEIAEECPYASLAQSLRGELQGNGRAVAILDSPGEKSTFAPALARTFLNSGDRRRVLFMDLEAHFRELSRNPYVTVEQLETIRLAGVRGETVLVIPLDVFQTENQRVLDRLLNEMDTLSRRGDTLPDVLFLLTERTWQTALSPDIREKLSRRAFRPTDANAVVRSRINRVLENLGRRWGLAVSNTEALISNLMSARALSSPMDRADRVGALLLRAATEAWRKGRDLARNVALEWANVQETLSSLPPLRQLPFRDQVIIRATQMPEDVATEVLAALAETDQLRARGAHASQISKLSDWLKRKIAVPYGQRAPPLIPDAATLEDIVFERLYRALDQDAQRLLDEGHTGSKEVKDYFLSQLAEDAHSERTGAPGLRQHICMSGPPGVGKTHFGRTIAKALRSPFLFLNMANVSDRADLVGHLRTYLSSREGAIAATLIEGDENAPFGDSLAPGVLNPVFMLDEVDKLPPSLQGAILDLLDPDSALFRDTFLGDIPTGEIRFILTCNDVANIIPPLRNRMTIVRMEGYEREEKIAIGRRHVLEPLWNRLRLSGRVNIPDPDALLALLADDYDREEGLRNMARLITRIVAWGIVEWMRTGRPVELTPDWARPHMGRPLPRRPIPNEDAIGRAFYPSPFHDLREVQTIPNPMAIPGAPQADPSHALAATLFSNHLSRWAKTLGIPLTAEAASSVLDEPRAARPDGPAGQLAMVVALVSRHFQLPVRREAAFMGELDGEARLKAVSSLWDRLRGARTAGARVIVLPKANREELFRILDKNPKYRGPILIPDSQTLIMPRSFSPFASGDNEAAPMEGFDPTPAFWKVALLRAAETFTPLPLTKGGAAFTHDDFQAMASFAEKAARIPDASARCVYILGDRVDAVLPRSFRVDGLPFPLIDPPNIELPASPPLKVTEAAPSAAQSIDIQYSEEGQQTPDSIPITATEGNITFDLSKAPFDWEWKKIEEFLTASKFPQTPSSFASFEALFRLLSIANPPLAGRLARRALDDFKTNPSQAGPVAGFAPATIGLLLDSAAAQDLADSPAKLRAAMDALDTGWINLIEFLKKYPKGINIPLAQIKTALHDSPGYTTVLGEATPPWLELFRLINTIISQEQAIPTPDQLSKIHELIEAVKARWNSMGLYIGQPGLSLPSERTVVFPLIRIGAKKNARAFLEALDNADARAPESLGEAWSAFEAARSIAEFERAQILRTHRPEGISPPADRVFGKALDAFAALMEEPGPRCMTLLSAPESLKNRFPAALARRLWNDGQPRRVISLNAVRLRVDEQKNIWRDLLAAAEAVRDLGDAVLLVDLGHLAQTMDQRALLEFTRLLNMANGGPRSLPIVFLANPEDHFRFLDDNTAYAQSVRVADLGEAPAVDQLKAALSLIPEDRPRPDSGANDFLEQRVRDGRVDIETALAAVHQAGIAARSEGLDSVEEAALRAALVTLTADSKTAGQSLDSRVRRQSPSLPLHARNRIKRLLGQRRGVGSEEAAGLENQVNQILAFPWSARSASPTPSLPPGASNDDWETFRKGAWAVLQTVRSKLDASHYGMDSVKGRINDYVAIYMMERALGLRSGGKGLLFVSKHGMGKSTIGKSIAVALGRKFGHLSCGAINSNQDLTGFSSGYVGAMPGFLYQTLVRAGEKDAVLLLDELDKMGKDAGAGRGSLFDDLLTFLDPTQNGRVRDNFIDIGADFSEVLFIGTANTLEGFPAPVLDRFDIIHLEDYQDAEKMAIAVNYLIPRIQQALRCGNRVKLPDVDALVRAAMKRTREPGVRELNAVLKEFFRRALRQSLLTGSTQRLDEALLDEVFPHHDGVSRGLLPRTMAVGSVQGTVVDLRTQEGELMPIEAIESPPLPGRPLTILGRAASDFEAALFRALHSIHVDDPLALENYFRAHTIAVYLDPIDEEINGPSAGAAMAVAVLSRLRGQPIRQDAVITGAVKADGDLLAIGSVGEKASAAVNAGAGLFFLPEENENDLRAFLDARWIPGRLEKWNPSQGAWEDTVQFLIKDLVPHHEEEELNKWREEAKTKGLQSVVEERWIRFTGSRKELDAFLESHPELFPRESETRFVIARRVRDIYERITIAPPDNSDGFGPRGEEPSGSTNGNGWQNGIPTAVQAMTEAFLAPVALAQAVAPPRLAAAAAGAVTFYAEGETAETPVTEDGKTASTAAIAYPLLRRLAALRPETSSLCLGTGNALAAGDVEAPRRLQDYLSTIKFDPREFVAGNEDQATAKTMVADLQAILADTISSRQPPLPERPSVSVLALDADSLKGPAGARLADLARRRLGNADSGSSAPVALVGPGWTQSGLEALLSRGPLAGYKNRIIIVDQADLAKADALDPAGRVNIQAVRNLIQEQLAAVGALPEGTLLRLRIGAAPAQAARWLGDMVRLLLDPGVVTVPPALAERLLPVLGSSAAQRGEDGSLTFPSRPLPPDWQDRLDADLIIQIQT